MEAELVQKGRTKYTIQHIVECVHSSLDTTTATRMDSNGQASKGRRKRRLLYLDWKELDGAAKKKRVLSLRQNDENEYICPVNGCLHIAFKSQRGIRKHINNIHPWYFYFDDQPKVNRQQAKEQSTSSMKNSTHKIPAFSLETGVGLEFLEWLQTPCGGGKKAKDAKHIGRRAMKFLMVAFDETTEESVLSTDYIDCCIGSPNIIMSFLKLIMEKWGLQSSAALSYIKSIGDLLDFRKANGVTDNVLRNFTVSEVYIRRGKENLAKRKKLEYSRNLELESLISRDSWATIEDMEKVIPFHSPKYQSIVKKAKVAKESLPSSDLAFATRFIVTFLFLRVKCTRPMTFQYLSLQMVKDAKTNGGYVDQTQFKTSDKYVFDTIVLTENVLKVLDSYIEHIRPHLYPKCEFLILTNNGTQYTAFGNAMSLLVHQAIGKSINPTRYRQIVETESALVLGEKEREAISKDQKHSSQVAKRIYQKRLSREVATEGRACMAKLTGTEKECHTKDLADSLIHLNEKPCSSEPNIQSINSEEMTDDDEVQYLGNDLVDVTATNDVVNDSDNNLGSQNLQEREEQVESNPYAEKESNVDEKIEDVETPSISSTQGKVVDLVEKEIKKEDLENSINPKTRRFTEEEDKFIKRGVEKYGYGNWKRILVDSEYTFHSSRTRDTIRMRAKTLRLSLKSSDGKRKKYSVRSRKNESNKNLSTN